MEITLNSSIFRSLNTTISNAEDEINGIDFEEKERLYAAFSKPAEEDKQSILEEIENIVKHNPQIKSCEMRGEWACFQVTKSFATDGKNGQVHYIGEPSIKINLRMFYKSQGSVNLMLKFDNNLRVTAFRSRCISPHIFNNGDYCLGGHLDSFVETFQQNDLDGFVQVALMFVQHANTEDIAGKYISSWPEAADFERTGDFIPQNSRGLSARIVCYDHETNLSQIRRMLNKFGNATSIRFRSSEASFLEDIEGSSDCISVLVRRDEEGIENFQKKYTLSPKFKVYHVSGNNFIVRCFYETNVLLNYPRFLDNLNKVLTEHYSNLDSNNSTEMLSYDANQWRRHFYQEGGDVNFEASDIKIGKDGEFEGLLDDCENGFHRHVAYTYMVNSLKNLTLSLLARLNEDLSKAREEFSHNSIVVNDGTHLPFLTIYDKKDPTRSVNVSNGGELTLSGFSLDPFDLRPTQLAIWKLLKEYKLHKIIKLIVKLFD